MANLASVVWQEGPLALLLGVHGEHAPSAAEWERYCSWIPSLLSQPNAGCVVLTDGGAPNSAQRDHMRKCLGVSPCWTAVITDKVLVRGVVTAIRWFNPMVSAFAPWELSQAFQFAGVSRPQVRAVCAALLELDKQLEPRSRVLAAALEQLSRSDAL